MNEAKFTKGPWSVSGERVGVIDTSITQSNGMMNEVAYIEMYDHGEGEGVANANLIASAPDMYWMLKSISEMSSEDAKIYLEYSSGITDLLSKARGENA